MKRLLPVLCVLSLVLLGGCQIYSGVSETQYQTQTTFLPSSSSGVSGLVGIDGRVLPPCPGSLNKDTWTNCAGTYNPSYPSGTKYVGEFKDGNFNGQGTYTDAIGRKYVGEWKDGKRHGQGTYTDAIGDKYVGEYRNGRKHGKGTYTDFMGNKYVGEFWNGKKNGQGTTTYANGSKYVGEWKDGKRNGQGTLTYADGTVKKGIWEYGTFLYAKKPSPTVTARKTYPPSPSAAEIEIERLYGIPPGPPNVYQPPFTTNDPTPTVIARTSSPPSPSAAEIENERLRKENARLKKEKKQKPRPKIIAKKPIPTVIAKKTPEQVVVVERTPKVDQQKRLELSRRTQEALQVLGLYSGKLDGIIGVITKSAIQRWQKRNGYSGTGEVTELQLAKLEQEAITHLAKKKLKPTVTAKKTEPKPVQKVPKRPDDVAVIIANSNYTKQGQDIPNVDPAYNDAKNIKKYFMESLGVREGNIIYLKDATGAQLMGVFGNKDNHKAQLFNWVKPNKSNVYVYYAGHGAPASKDGSAFLVPSDAKSQTIEFSGYPLTNLYRNLGKIKARSVTVILEACFSGFSQAGALLPRSSGITITPKEPTVPSNVKVISAGAADQMASWEKDESQSLFTKYFLLAMRGEGDKKPYGNGDGKVQDTELQNYLDDTMTYYARRYYGRDQRVQIVKVR